jgi:drug/metabolite transporter (DMT)-like permease
MLLFSVLQVSGAAMAYAFLGERWGPMGWAGAAVILAASVACQLGGAFEDDGKGGKGKEDAKQIEA